jgi:TolA-binding protein
VVSALPVVLLAVDPFSINLNNPSNLNVLTPQERAIVKNREKILKLEDQLAQLAQQFKQQKILLNSRLTDDEEKLQAIKNQLDGINSTLVDFTSAKLQVETNTQAIQQLKTQLNQLQNRVTALEKGVKKLAETQDQNFKILKETMQQILNQLAQIGGKVTPAGNVTPPEVEIKLSPRQAFRKAKRLFADGNLEGAERLFLYVYNKNYMPATTAYYLGEINFERGKYKEAIAFYKESLTRYPKKLSFTSRMLYHLGMAFKELGYTDKAKLTFKKLVRDFNDKYSRLAKEQLKNL